MAKGDPSAVILAGVKCASCKGLAPEGRFCDRCGANLHPAPVASESIPAKRPGSAPRPKPFPNPRTPREFLANGDYDEAWELLKKAGLPQKKDEAIYNLLRRVIGRRRGGGLFAAQQRYDEKMEIASALASLGLGAEAAGVLDDSALVSAAKEDTDAYMVAEIFDRAGEARHFAAAAGAERPAEFYSAYVSAFEKRNQPEPVLALLKLKESLSPDDYPSFIWANARLGKLEAVEAAAVPERHRVLLAEAWVEREGEKRGLEILDAIPRKNWKPREYVCGMRAMQRLGRPEKVRAFFTEASRVHTLEQAPELHYYYALFCERMAEIDKAESVYKELLAKLGGYRDAAERLANLALISPEERTRASTALTATSLRETLTEQGQAQAAPQVPLVARRFEIIRPLGVGGMGIVFRARDSQLGHDVALKKMKAGASAGDAAKQRFLNEAQTLAELKHPGIVAAFGTVDWAGEVYIICELVEGETLGELLVGRGKFSPGDCSRVLSAVCAAIAHAHGKGVVHRDIKPGNIMQDRRGAVKVMDFGIALHQDALRQTADGAAVGTPAYMAPEQHIGQADFRSDFYALGVTAYELLTGNLPFMGGDLGLLKRKGTYQALGPEIPRALRDFVSACLKPEPGERPASAAECEQLLAGARPTGQA